ncbi:MAG: protein kinase [Vulcanimicrobiota bacterium]
MKVTLSVVAGPMTGQERVFDEPDLFLVGRNEACHYNLQGDPFLSRNHFLLEISPPDIALRDLGSMNGTYINGTKFGGRIEGESQDEAKKRQQSITLNEGDLIKVGKTEIKVKIEQPVACTECGKEIADEEKKASEFTGGTYLCQQCRRREAEKLKPEPVRQPAKPVEVKAPKVQEPPVAPVVAVTPPKKEEDDADRLLKGLLEDRKKVSDNPGAVIDEFLKQLLLKGIQIGDRKEEYPSIAGYQIKKKLGNGGFGAVYLAFHEKTGKDVALKTMLQTKKPSEKSLRLFNREIEVNQSLNHPNIISVEEHGDYRGIRYFSLELMDCGSVWDLMGQGRKALSVNDAVPIMLQTLEGLAYAHSREIIHRDLKPPNLLLSRRGGSLVAKVSDFGLAKVFTQSGMTQNKITEVGTFCGSPPYIAPEHIFNYRFLQPETDVFEMAATFYHMLTGRVVWEAGGKDILNIVLQSSVKPIRSVNGAVPAGIAGVLDKALSVAPDQRYHNAGAMLEALRKAL